MLQVNRRVAPFYYKIAVDPPSTVLLVLRVNKAEFRPTPRDSTIPNRLKDYPTDSKSPSSSSDNEQIYAIDGIGVYQRCLKT